MLAPRSYTREDVIELQCHGSEVCLRRVLKACLEAGARLAEPGVFSETGIAFSLNSWTIHKSPAHLFTLRVCLHQN